MALKEHTSFVAISEALQVYLKHVYFQVFDGTLKKELYHPLVMGQCQFRSIQMSGQTSDNTSIMVINEHKIFVALSESLY